MSDLDVNPKDRFSHVAAQLTRIKKSLIKYINLFSQINNNKLKFLLSKQGDWNTHVQLNRV